MPIEIQRFNQAVESIASEELNALAEEIAGRINANAPVAEGHLRGSFAAIGQPLQAGYSITAVGSPLWYGAGGYGAYVETGTKPHWMPFEPIRRWVENKLQPHILALGVSFKTGKARPTGRPTRQLRGDARERAILSLAHAIQVSISKKGTRAQWFVRKALDSLGLTYRFVQSETEVYYQIDTRAWLEKQSPSIWERIKAQL